VSGGTSQVAKILYKHGICNWPGCDSKCDSLAHFNRYEYIYELPVCEIPDMSSFLLNSYLFEIDTFYRNGCLLSFLPRSRLPSGNCI